MLLFGHCFVCIVVSLYGYVALCYYLISYRSCVIDCFGFGEVVGHIILVLSLILSGMFWCVSKFTSVCM